MTEQEKRILYLLERLENKQATSGELEELDRWYESFQNAPTLTDRISEQEAEQVRARMLNNLERQVRAGLVLSKGNKRRTRWPLAAITAITIIVVALLTYRLDKVDKVSGTENDIAAGKNAAFLFIPGNTPINLESVRVGIIFKSAYLTISKDSAGLITYHRSGSVPDNDGINRLMTPAGGTFSVALEDGSRIWINAKSQVSFPAGFSGNERRVQLQGEAYFEVAKNKTKPFLVQTPQQRIRVLGTHFNVHAYTDERIQKTTLLEGLVQVSTLEPVAKTVVIQPGQQAEQDHGLLQIRAVNPADAVGWKNGLFVFDHTELHDLMLQLSRWYNVEIVYQGKFQRRVFSGEIPKSYSLAEVLKVLELGSVHFKIEKANHAGNLKKLIILP